MQRVTVRLLSRKAVWKSLVSCSRSLLRINDVLCSCVEDTLWSQESSVH